MAALIILQQMLVLFAMMVIGYFSYKGSWLDKNACSKLSKIVVNIMNPLLVIDGVLAKDSGEDGRKLLVNLILVMVYFAFLILISFPIAKLLKPEKQSEPLYRLMMIFSNVGFMGIPVISGLYGSSVVIYIVFYILGYNFLLYTYGILLARKSADMQRKELKENKAGSFSQNKNMKENNNKQEEAKNQETGFADNLKLILNPGVIAGVIAIFIFACNISVPKPVAVFTSYMGQCCVPMSMILIGASMAQHELKMIFRDMKMYIFLGIRLLVIPAVAALVVRRLAIDPQLLGVFILMLAMPVGSIVVLLASEQGADETVCTKGSVISTLLSILTIPVVAFFLP